MARPSTFVLLSAVALGVASVVVYATTDQHFLAGILMFVALTDGVLGVFLRQRMGR